MNTTTTDFIAQVAVISGAGSGIGEGLARHAASRLGMIVVVADVDLERAEAVAREIRDDGGRAVAFRVDVADWSSVRRMAEVIEQDHGAPALLVCNAGVEMTGLVWETDPEHWERIQAINVNGAFHLMRAFLPGMLEREGRGHILCTSSIGGIAVGASQSAYTVSKHAIRVLGQSLAADLDSAGANIGVSILLPGAVRTRIFDDAVTTGVAGAEEYRSQLAAHLANDGLSPAVVADLTFKHIAAGARWIHTHPEVSATLLNQHAAELAKG